MIGQRCAYGLAAYLTQNDQQYEQRRCFDIGLGHWQARMRMYIVSDGKRALKQISISQLAGKYDNWP